MNIHSCKKKRKRKESDWGKNNIGLYFMVFIVNIKCVQLWLWAFAQSWTVLIIVVVHRYTGSLKVETSKHAGRLKHITAALSEEEVK